MRIRRSERVEYFREVYGADWVWSAARMAGRMRPEQRERLGRLQSEQGYLLARGEPDPHLDPALAVATAGEPGGIGESVAFARANRNLMGRALGEARAERAPQPGAMDVLSLCSGIGGLDIGLRTAVPEARVVCYVEGAAACQEVLLGRMAEGVLDRAPVYGNLKSFDGNPWRGVVDCVVGGYPCQPFSAGGKRRGKEDVRHLWPHVARVVGECRPEWCLFENVDGHVSLGLRAVIRTLVGAGYRVALGIFPARELGAPHERERLFVMAHSDARGLHDPAPIHRWRTVSDGHGGGSGSVQGVRRGASAVRPEGQEAAPAPPDLAAVGSPGPFPPAPADPAWRGVLDRDPSLHPRDGEGKLSPLFVERLMGFPRGWTDAPGVSREERLAMLGNAVVPVAAALAWRELTAALEADNTNR